MIYASPFLDFSFVCFITGPTPASFSLSLAFTNHNFTIIGKQTYFLDLVPGAGIQTQNSHFKYTTFLLRKFLDKICIAIVLSNLIGCPFLTNQNA